MISNQVEDEFVAVRVQDPRMQNEGSWNSHVDYKIFLHTNSKAFTAKTSCVRRRYSEFVWLKKNLQKNAGLVPVPELPGKSFFFFSNEDFLERRRKGLQAFLDSVVNMTVCLSDSQLHLFLQTQLPVGHIQDCVQGHTPYSVTDAILTYASSNRGYDQAQEEDSVKEPSLTVSYESMESPAPHQPSLQPKDVFSPELSSCDDSNAPEGLPEIGEKDAVELQHEENSSVRVVQTNHRLEAVVEYCGPTEATFFLGDSLETLERLGLVEQTQQRSCRVQTPVEVHSPIEEECSVREGVTASDTAEQTEPQTEEVTEKEAEEEKEADQRESSGEAKMGSADSEPEDCANSAAILDFKDQDFEERGTESDAGSQEEVPDAVCAEQPVLETHATSEVGGLELVEGAEVRVEDAGSPEEVKNPDRPKDEAESKAETALQSETALESESETALQLETALETETATETPLQSETETPLESETETALQSETETALQLETALETETATETPLQSETETALESESETALETETPLESETETALQSETETALQTETPLQSEIHEETGDVLGVPEEEEEEEEEEDGCDDLVQQTDRADLDSDGDGRSSSNESIAKVTDDESDAEDSIHAANGHTEEVDSWSPLEASSRNVVHTNGHSVEKEDLKYTTDVEDSGKSLDLNLTVTGEDLTESGDFSIIESIIESSSSAAAELAVSSEETREVEAH